MHFWALVFNFVKIENTCKNVFMIIDEAKPLK